MEIFKLFGSIMVDTAKAEQSLDKTDNKALSVARSMGEGTKKALAWGAGLVAAAVGVGVAMVKSARETAANMDEIDKASKRMGISAEEYQELAHAAELCGVEMSTMEKAAKKLEGTDLSFDDALAQIWELETAEERSAKAAELFGDSIAYELSPMLEASGEEMEAMKEEARSLGLVMSNEAVAAGAAMNDSFTKLSEAGESIKNQIGLALMPAVQGILDWVVEHIPEIQAFVDGLCTFIGEAIDALKPLFEALGPVIEAVFGFIGELWETSLKPIFMGIIDFLTNVFSGNWEGAFNALVDIVKSIWTGLVEIIKLPLNGIISLINSVFSAIGTIKIPDWVPFVGGSTFSLPQIPMLANGGDINAPGTVMVGERGPELLNLPSGASVTPLSKAGASKEDIKAAIVEALTDMLPQLKTVFEVVPNETGIFDVVVSESNRRAGSGSASIAVW